MRLYNFWKQVKKKKRKNKFAITSYSFTLNFDTRHLTINLDTFITEQNYNFRKFCKTCTKEKERVVTKLTTIVHRLSACLLTSIKDEQLDELWYSIFMLHCKNVGQFTRVYLQK